MSENTWFVDHCAVATSNMNGWCAKPRNCKEQRRRLLLRMLKEQRVHICAVQEHRVTTALELQSEQLWLEKQGYAVAAVPTP